MKTTIANFFNLVPKSELDAVIYRLKAEKNETFDLMENEARLKHIIEDQAAKIQSLEFECSHLRAQLNGPAVEANTKPADEKRTRKSRIRTVKSPKAKK